MSIASRIQAIEQHLTDDYNVLEVAGADLTNVNKNILNLKSTWQERLLYFINNGTDVVWNNWEKVIGEGTELTLNNTLEGKMKINLKGNTSQEGTPTPDYPQDIHVVSGDNSIDIVGKNYFNKDIGEWRNWYLTPTGTWGSNNSLMNIEFTKVEPNTTYTWSWEWGTLADSMYWIGGMWQFCDKNKTPYSRNQGGEQGSATGTSVTFTTDSNCYYVRVAYYNLKKDGQNVTVDLTNHTYSDYVKNIQIEKGTEKTTWEEYKGASYPINLGDIELCKIGDYQDKIDKSSGKNLFDKNNINGLNVYLDTTNNKLVSNNNNKSIYISCKPNTTYTISKTPSKRFGVAYTYTTPENNTAIYGTIANYDGASITITTDTNAQYLVVWLINSNISGEISYQTAIDTLQIEYGNQVSTYEPYGNVWYLNKQIGNVVLNGSESWSKSSSSINDIFVGNDVLSNNASLTNRASSISNYFTYNQSITITNKFYITDNKKTIAIVFTAHGNTTLEQFITWISTHNTSVYYILETPTYTEITDSTLLSQLNALAKSYNSQTNISQNNNDLPFIINATALKEMA